MLVEVCRLPSLVRNESVSSGIVEDDDVVLLNLSQPFHASVVPLRPLYVRLASEEGQSVLCEWHGEWCLRNARSVAHFRHAQVVAREE